MEKKKKSKAPARRKTHIAFRRFVSGIATVSVVLVFVGGLLADASVAAITWRAFVVWFFIIFGQWVLLKTYMAYETTRGSERGSSSESSRRQ